MSGALAESREAMTILIGRQIAVIDGDAGVRDGIFAVLDGAGFAVRTYMSAGHFLSDYTSRGGCVVANMLLPDMDGLELLQQITRQGMDKPVVLFSAEADVPLAVATMKAGAWIFYCIPSMPSPWFPPWNMPCASAGRHPGAAPRGARHVPRWRF